MAKGHHAYAEQHVACNFSIATCCKLNGLYIYCCKGIHCICSMPFFVGCSSRAGHRKSGYSFEVLGKMLCGIDGGSIRWLATCGMQQATLLLATVAHSKVALCMVALWL